MEGEVVQGPLDACITYQTFLFKKMVIMHLIKVKEVIDRA